MFIEAKEYQAIKKIYEKNVYSTPEEKIVIDALEEQNFTLEELEYIIENIDELLSDTYITEGIEQEQLDEFAKAVVKAAVPLAKTMAQGFSKNVNKIPAKNVVGGSVAKTIEKGKNLLKTGADKIKPFMSGAKQKLNSVVDKIKKPIMNNKAATGAVGALGAVGAATQLGAKKPTEINKINPKQFDNRRIKKIDPKQFDNRREPEVKTNKFVEKNPPKEGSARAKMRAKNVERFGKERVQKLVQKNQEFQAAKKSGNLAQYRKDNPKLTGKERAQAMFLANKKKKEAAAKPKAEVQTKPAETPSGDKLKAGSFSISEKGKKQAAANRAEKKQTSNTSALNVSSTKKAAMANEEFTPYDIVLEYLLSTEQAATIEEANYIMTEMDAKTIQDIVS